MHQHSSYKASFKHLHFDGTYTILCVNVVELKCSCCGHTKTQEIPFKADKHFITKSLKRYIRELLRTNNYTNKDIAFFTGINRNVVKEIDKERLIEKYTVDGLGKELVKSDSYTKYLGIDDFKLHNG